MSIDKAIEGLDLVHLEQMNVLAWARTFGVSVEKVDELAAARLKHFEDLEVLRRREETPE